jgi:hypothetical protein
MRCQTRPSFLPGVNPLGAQDLSVAAPEKRCCN